MIFLADKRSIDEASGAATARRSYGAGDAIGLRQMPPFVQRRRELQGAAC